MQKKKYIIIFLIIFLILQVFCSCSTMATNNFKTKKVVSKNEELDEVNNMSNYSEAYKKWLSLSNKEKEKLGVIPRKYNIPLDSIYENTVTVKENPSLFNLFGLLGKEKLISVYANEIPTKFDLRDEIDILVENQGYEGLCWAFSSLTALETNLAINKYGNYDFSERHLDYLTSYYFGGIRQLNSSGNFEIFSDYIVKNNGPVLEETVPYNTSYTSDQYEYLNNLKSQAYVIEKVDFPTIDKLNYKYSEEKLTLFRDKVKKHIIENGSIYVNILSEEIMGILVGENDINYTLYNTTGNVDHAVSIIGWNDNYPKENFKDENGKVPQNNGAYIALNSWGKNAEIVYISYEDYTVEREMSGIVSATTDVNEVGTMEVTFNDINLYNYMKTAFPKATISVNDQTKSINFLGYFNSLPITLDISEQNISDVSGLEKFKLKILGAHTNKITDLSKLGDMTELYWLDLRNNNLSNINKLGKLTNLRELYLDYNNISDMGALENLIKLEVLSAHTNKITDISKLKKLTQLRSLNLKNNSISEVSALENLINLRELDMESNNISDISKFKNLVNLENLKIGYNKVNDVSSLKNATKLIVLDISGNKIENIKSLENLTQLIELWAMSNNISDITPLANLNNLENLVISYNKISDTSVLKKLTKLEYVSLTYNTINQKINFSKDKIVNIPIPNIIKEAQKEESVIYADKGISLKNCTWNIDKTSISVDTSLYSEANVIINGGCANGTSFNITVTNAVTGITIKKSPKTTYTKGEKLDLTEGIITATYSDGKTTEILMNNSDVISTGYNENLLGNQTITIEYEGYKTTFVVEVIEEKVEEIKSDKFKIIEDGEVFAVTGIMPKTNLEELKQNIQTKEMFDILDLKNSIVSDASIIGTGHKIKMASGKTYTLIVYGDMTGDGEISISELAVASRIATAANVSIEKIKFMAIDINNDGNIKVSDLSVISRLQNK